MELIVQSSGPALNRQMHRMSAPTRRLGSGGWSPAFDFFQGWDYHAARWAWGFSETDILTRIAKQDIPARINVSGAIARQALNFGDATAYGNMAGEYFSLKAGTDIAPLLKGLESDLCQSPHWGYLLEGEVTVTYSDGTEETVMGGDLFYWPPGHSLRVSADAEVVLFSPQAEHCAVVDHLRKQLAG